MSGKTYDPEQVSVTVAGVNVKGVDLDEIAINCDEPEPEVLIEIDKFRVVLQGDTITAEEDIDPRFVSLKGVEVDGVPEPPPTRPCWIPRGYLKAHNGSFRACTILFKCLESLSKQKGEI